MNHHPYQLGSRAFQSEDTIIEVGDIKIGGGNFVKIGGPCSVESREQIFTIAKVIKEAGGQILRGGVFKPRTNPYAFQGLGIEGLKLMREAADKYQLKVVTEVMNEKQIDDVIQYADLIQIGARNMQNYDLLRAVGKQEIPVLLKRGLSATIEEWLSAAEYIANEGNRQIILVERGIRTFSDQTRNTFDISAIPVIHQLSHYPIIVDPSHATGNSDYVTSMTYAGIAAGADGFIIEVHHNPNEALSDGMQSLNLEQWQHLMHGVNQLLPTMQSIMELKE